MMGGGKEKALGTITSADFRAETGRQDPQLTNGLGRFRMWAPIVNPAHCSPPRAAVPGTSPSCRICWSTVSLSAVPHKPGSKYRIFYPSWHQGGGAVLFSCWMPQGCHSFTAHTEQGRWHHPLFLHPWSWESSAPSLKLLPLCSGKQCWLQPQNPTESVLLG